MKEYFTWGYLSALLIAISAVPYLWGIYRGTVPRPVLSTWGIWAALGGLLLLAYYEAGARMDTSLPAAWLGFTNPVVIFVLALFFGQWTWSRLETWCIAVFLITVALWQSAKHFGDFDVRDAALIGLVGGIVADAMGCIPQIKHCWKAPQDEPWFPWTLFCVGSAVNLLGLREWNLQEALFPMYMTIGSFLIAAPLIVHRLR